MAIPSILLSQSHINFCNDELVLEEAFIEICQNHQFKVIEVLPFRNESIRNNVSHIAKLNGIAINVWLTFELRDRHLNLADLDRARRQSAIDFVIREADGARKVGAKYLSISSPPDVKSELRPEAIEAFYDSMGSICGACDDLLIGFEPFDREAHKKGLIGPTSDFIPLAARLKNTHPHFGLIWDSAHVSLCGDNLLDSLREASSFLWGIHLANAVLDKSNSLFGDNHIKLGPPGNLNVELCRDLITILCSSCCHSEEEPFVSIEVATGQGSNPMNTVHYCERILSDILTANGGQ